MSFYFCRYVWTCKFYIQQGFWSCLDRMFFSEFVLARFFTHFVMLKPTLILMFIKNLKAWEPSVNITRLPPQKLPLASVMRNWLLYISTLGPYWITKNLMHLLLFCTSLVYIGTLFAYPKHGWIMTLTSFEIWKGIQHSLRIAQTDLVVVLLYTYGMIV